MTYFKKYILFSLASLLFLGYACSPKTTGGQGSVSAALDRTRAPEPGPAPEVRMGEYESFQLDNGLTVFVVENHKIPYVSFSLALDLDPIKEENKAGYVSMAGDMLRRGTETRTKGELDEAIDLTVRDEKLLAGEKDILKRLVTFGDVTVRQIMRLAARR